MKTRWIAEGAIYWCAFAGASLGATAVAIAAKQPVLPFYTFVVVLLAGIAIAMQVSKQPLLNPNDPDAPVQDISSRNKSVATGVILAIAITVAAVLAYIFMYAY